MRFYIDFEATQPEQEIISIGAVCENGATFYSLVKPQFSSVSKYITDMTGITQEMVNGAPTLNTVLGDFSAWCYNQEKLLTSWRFISYGDGDIDFLKQSICNVIGEQQTIIASIMIAKMEDYSKKVAKYFCSTVSLIKAFNYFKELETKQNHNALEDAKMLAMVVEKVEGTKPLEASPFHVGQTTKVCYTFPSGKFFCKMPGDKKERSFVDIQDAITWLINNYINKNSRDTVHRDRIAVKIMKAIRKNNTYMGYKWRREKNLMKELKVNIKDERRVYLSETWSFKGTKVDDYHWILPLVEDGKTKFYQLVINENYVNKIENDFYTFSKDEYNDDKPNWKATLLPKDMIEINKIKYKLVAVEEDV